MSLLRLHGDTLAAPGALDFATCLWPGPLPPAIEAALHAGLADRARYPDAGPARAAIAARHRRHPDEVLLLNGACEAFWLLAHALRPARAACVHPSFTEPEAALRAAGTEVQRVQLEPGDWSLRAGAVPEAAELVVIGNPNNPTGTLTPPAAILALARPGRIVVVDESFIELTVDAAGASLAECAGAPGLVIVRSATKLYSLAGIRCGYLLADRELVTALEGQRQPWSVNALACHALAACAAEVSTPRLVAAEVAGARAELLAALREMPRTTVWPSAANFLLVHAADGPEIAAGLRRHGVAVRPAASFPGLGDEHLRIAVRPPADNARLLAAWTSVIEGRC
jgi:histidinol-phosphate/aromatic aminotransferase/cobyric acid decarboxylase-like protein